MTEITRILVVEDTKARARWFTSALCMCSVQVISDAAEAIEALRRETFDYVCLDHDLVDQGPGHGSGRDVALAVIAERLASDGTRFVVHSINSVSAAKIQAELTAAGYPVIRQPFHLLRMRIGSLQDLRALFAEVPA